MEGAATLTMTTEAREFTLRHETAMSFITNVSSMLARRDFDMMNSYNVLIYTVFNMNFSNRQLPMVWATALDGRSGHRERTSGWHRATRPRAAGATWTGSPLHPMMFSMGRMTSLMPTASRTMHPKPED